MKNASTDDLRKTAQSYGMTTLRDVGLQNAYDGTTTIDEVVRDTVLEA